MLAVHNKKNELTLRTMLVEQFVMSSVVLWESFLNDLFLAYALEQPETALGSLRKRITQSIDGKFGQHAASCFQFSVKKPLTKQRLIALLDPKNWNITVTSAQELASKANDLLHARFAKTFSLTKTDGQFFDYVIALRNFLSHRSKGSRAILNEAVARLTEPENHVFKGSTKNIGGYLKTTGPNAETRAIALAARLVSFASKL